MSQSRRASALVSRRDVLGEAGIAEFSLHPFAEARTDRIALEAGISKGLIFHLFGSKRAFYLSCLTIALERLTTPPPPVPEESDPVAWLVATAKARFEVAAAEPQATALVNRAARETSSDVVDDARALLARHHAARRDESRGKLAAWVRALPLRPEVDAELVTDAVDLHVAAWLGRCMASYESRPEAFLADADVILAGLRPHVELLLHGALTEEGGR